MSWPQGQLASVAGLALCCAQPGDRVYGLLHERIADHDQAAETPAATREFTLTPRQTVVGEVHEYAVQPGEDLNEIARKFDVGYTALAAANPGVDQFAPGVGRRLIIPSLYVLPDTPRQGVVINLAQYRMFYFPPGGNRVETFPVGLGQVGKTTPLGATRVVRKERSATWYPPRKT